MKKRLPLSSILAIAAFALIMLLAVAYFAIQVYIPSQPICSGTPVPGPSTQNGHFAC